ncbi:MAG TPA: ATP-binding protein [Thermoanaerobaculia bacterium]|nr:ATP-binding protein [Thermoanaerobaculia bacterium]
MRSILTTPVLILLATILLILAVGAGLLRALEVLGPVRSAAWIVVLTFTIPLTGAWLGWLRTGRVLRQIERQSREGLIEADAQNRFEDDETEPLASIRRALQRWPEIAANQRRRITELELVQNSIIQSIGEGVLAVDQRRNVVFANRRLLELFSLPEPGSRLPFYQFIRQSAVHRAIDRALTSRQGSSALITVQTGDSVREIDLHVFPVADESEIATIALFIDVTRLVRLERVRRDFITDFSHETRTPLAGLRSAVETLDRGGLAPEDEQQLRKIVSRQIIRLERLLDDLSELNRIEAGELVLQKQPLNLLDLVSDVAADFRDRAAARSISLSVEGAPLQADADAQRIQQVVSNLTDNAIKFSRAGGRVRLAVHSERDMAVIVVEDQGEGIPQEEQERIFNRFYRVDKSRSQEIRGTGLGLAIAKHLTALHGGRIELRSSPGKGSTFRVILPGGAGPSGKAAEPRHDDGSGMD